MKTLSPKPVSDKERTRRLPIGAEVCPDGDVHFRVWAPLHKRAQVIFDQRTAEPLELDAENEGYFSGTAGNAVAGMTYRFRFDDADMLYPDPASRFQPAGPSGPSQIVDPTQFEWTDENWRGITPRDQVIYELHIGTFTRGGTWSSAEAELPALAELGITCIEVMPVAEFPGKFGWGYDGVDQFAPSHLYGKPDHFRHFVNLTHELNLGVILDVVYNHFGPDGNYLKEFSADYFTKHYKTDWGEAINFDGENSHGVREYFLANARYWIEEFHLDGFRFDATQNIYDSSSEHILAAISRTARAAAGRRSIILVNENEPQHTILVRKPEAGGYGMDALWNDDFHHSALVAMTGRRGAYLDDYSGTASEFIAMAKFGYLFQGQFNRRIAQRRGTPTFGLQDTAFINFLENHDQVSNLARGLRVHQLTSMAQYRAMVALLLLGPGTPMLFQGQEFATSSPFNFFADHNPELSRLVRKGRGEFLGQFPNAATPAMQSILSDPSDPATFERCRLNLAERTMPGHAEIYAMYRDLLRLRRTQTALTGRWPGELDGAVLQDRALLLRFFDGENNDRILLVNLGGDVRMREIAEPLLAPPMNKAWRILWSSEDPKYLGDGIAPLTDREDWTLPGHCAVLLEPIDCDPDFRDARVYLEAQKVKSTP